MSRHRDLALGLVAFTTQPDQSVVIVFFMLGGAGVLPSWRVAQDLALDFPSSPSPRAS